MDFFDNNKNSTFNINHNTTIKDYFDGLDFYQERYFNNIKKLFTESSVTALIGLFFCFMDITFTNWVIIPFFKVIAYLFLMAAIVSAAVIIRFLRFVKDEKLHYEYSVKILIDRLTEDGVTLNQKEIQTKLNLKDAFKKHKIMYAAVALITVFFICILIAAVQFVQF